MERFIGRIDFFFAAAVTLLSAVFGVYWYLFAAFLILNITDYVTGIIKARYTKTENSAKGFQGIVKKLGGWVILAIAFFISYAFGSLGELIGMDLGFTVILGWFVLAASIINEIRSILENLVEIGVEVPPFLIKGLEAANKKINNGAGEENENRD